MSPPEKTQMQTKRSAKLSIEHRESVIGNCYIISNNIAIIEKKQIFAVHVKNKAYTFFVICNFLSLCDVSYSFSLNSSNDQGQKL